MRNTRQSTNRCNGIYILKYNHVYVSLLVFFFFHSFPFLSFCEYVNQYCLWWNDDLIYGVDVLDAVDVPVSVTLSMDFHRMRRVRMFIFFSRFVCRLFSAFFRIWFGIVNRNRINYLKSNRWDKKNCLFFGWVISTSKITNSSFEIE